MPEFVERQHVESPGGFVFGIQGWRWGIQSPQSITFFLDNTAMVADQHGRAIRGTSVDGREVLFARGAPQDDEKPGARAKLATHAQVIEALAAERINWCTLTRAGWPQVGYEVLKAMGTLPPTPVEELLKIKDADLRKAALRAHREAEEERTKQEAAERGE